MKQKPTKKCENGVQLRPASIEEAGLFYSELDQKQDEALGTVGHIRMDFGSGGREFGIPGGLTTRIDSILWNSRKNSKLSLTPYEQTGR